jgi:hypothetical protein
VRHAREIAFHPGDLFVAERRHRAHPELSASSISVPSFAVNQKTATMSYDG